MKKRKTRKIKLVVILIILLIILSALLVWCYTKDNKIVNNNSFNKHYNEKTIPIDENITLEKEPNKADESLPKEPERILEATEKK